MKDALGNVDSALVLGGTSDIGVAIAKALTQRGASKIVLAGRDPSGLLERVDELRSAGAGRVETLDFNALEYSNHEHLISEAFSRFGDLDVVILAWGLLGDQQKAVHKAEDALPIVMTNYVAAVSLGVHLTKAMEDQGHGTIVVLSSVAGERARRANFTYGSSKAGLDAYWQGAAMQLRDSGVQVLIVRPGFVRTKMTSGLKPPPLTASPEMVGEAVTRALAKNSEVIWVPSRLRWVMMVIRHLPTKLFRRIKF